MVSFDSSAAVAIAMGVGLGILGFMPLLLPFALARRFGAGLSVGKGIAAVAVSFLFLMGALGAVWLHAPDRLLAVAVGFIVGFIAMWGVLACMAVRHKL